MPLSLGPQCDISVLRRIGSGEFDGAVCDIGISRWSNYYLEGLRHMTENAPHTSGIYFDGINFGRGTMLRIRRTLDAAVGEHLLVISVIFDRKCKCSPASCDFIRDDTKDDRAHGSH